MIYIVPSKKQTRAFGILLLLSEIVTIFIFAFYISYVAPSPSLDGYFIISSFIVLAVCGFVLSISHQKSITLQLFPKVAIIFAISIQLYFPLKGLWEVIGVTGNRFNTSDNVLLPVSITNEFNDRMYSQKQTSSALTDYFACFISLIIAFSLVSRRINLFGLYFLSVIGTLIYQLISMIFWLQFVTDCGFGMRIFLFAGSFGLFLSIVLQSTPAFDNINDENSKYEWNGISFLGSIIVWIFLPVLAWSDLWHNTTVGNDSYILHMSCLNIWFALCGSVVGSFVGSLLFLRKLQLTSILSSIFSGGIAFISSSDLHFNPGSAMGIGCLTSLLCSSLTFLFRQRKGKQRYLMFYKIICTYLIPGTIAGVLSAIFQASSSFSSSSYKGNSEETRTAYVQGGFQIAGLCIVLLGGCLAGLLVGSFTVCVRRCLNVNDDNKKQFMKEFQQLLYHMFTKNSSIKLEFEKTLSEKLKKKYPNMISIRVKGNEGIMLKKQLFLVSENTVGLELRKTIQSYIMNKDQVESLYIFVVDKKKYRMLPLTEKMVRLYQHYNNDQGFLDIALFNQNPF